MSIPVVAFFNNKGGVGKTTMVYHLAWMLADQGLTVIAADLDPQSNLTAAFLDEDRLEQVIALDDHSKTIYGALRPLKDGEGDVSDPHIEHISKRLGLISGDMAVSTFEDQLSEVWPKCMSGDPRAFRVTSAFYRIMQKAGYLRGADVICMDLGPNLGAINRAALISADYIVVPLGPDLFSIQGLRNLGPAVRRWRDEWKERLQRNPVSNLLLPTGSIETVGYIVVRHSIRLDRPVKAFDRWIAKIPEAYASDVLQKPVGLGVTIDDDPNCIAKLRDYRSLMPLAQEAHKPMFHLKAADGALGAHANAVIAVNNEFFSVAKKIRQLTNLK